MDAEGITFSLHTLLTIIAMLGSGLTVYHVMNSKIKLMQQHNIQQDKDMIDHKDLQKDNDVIIHKRIDGLKEESVANWSNLTDKYDGISNGLNDLKLEIANNKSEIIREIHKIKKS